MTGKNLTLLLLSLVLWLFCACKNTKTSGAASKGIIRKKMLVAAEIESIQILALPRYGKDGEAWDAYAPFATDPDPFLVILWNESPLYKSETLNNQSFRKTCLTNYHRSINRCCWKFLMKMGYPATTILDLSTSIRKSIMVRNRYCFRKMN
jgi:hypothetical protein